MQPQFLVLDDHVLVRDGIKRLLEDAYPGCVVVYCGENLKSAVDTLAEAHCDVAVVDLDLGLGVSPIEVVSTISMYGVAVVVVSALGDPEVVRGVCVAGAVGYVTKRADRGDLLRAVEAALAGESWVHPDLAAAMARTPSVPELSARETRALVLYASGMTVGMVARRMGIADSTVKYYLDNVRAKYAARGVHARTKTELNAVARQAGLIP